MLKVIMTEGLPGSGKSHWAKSKVRANPGQYVRVNKDDLRAMLHDSVFSKSNEKQVLAVRDMIILASLKSGKHVIVDDTNLNGRHYSHICKLVKQNRTQVKVTIECFRDVPLKTCIAQDLKRFNSVGKDVIVKMYNQYFKKETVKLVQDESLKKAIICDLDGTLCQMVDRGPFEGWKCGSDEVDIPVRNILERFKDDYEIILLSGRNKALDETINWLIKNEIEYHSLYMRADDDMRSDRIVKKEFYERYVEGKFNVEFVLDDRDQVVELWRELGLKCLQVQEGDF